MTDTYGQDDQVRTWSVAEAKSRLSALLEATRSGPQVISRRGHAVAVVVSSEQWARRTARHDTLADFLASSPLRGSGLRVERLPDAPRPTRL